MDVYRFEDRAKKFSKCRIQIKRGKGGPNYPGLNDAMEGAAKALFAAVEAKAIQFRDLPPWIKREPKGRGTFWNQDVGSVEAEVTCWSAYWLFAVDWLARNRLEAGIVFPTCILTEKMRDNPEQYFTTFSIQGFLYDECRIHGKYHETPLCNIADVSEDACLYLAGLLSSKPASKRRKGKIGRPRKHSEDKVKAADKLFHDTQKEGKTVGEGWLEVSTKLGFESPEAAKMAVYRFNKQNKKQK